MERKNLKKLIVLPNHGNGSVYTSKETVIESNVLIMSGVCIFGATIIGQNCVIWPNSVIIDSRIGENCEIKSSWIVGAEIGKNVIVGPFANIRPGTVIHDGATIGTAAEIKNSTIGRNSKIPHHCYVGDAIIGENVNFSAGAITCNYDGKQKHKTVIGDNAFIGSGVEIIAPRVIGKNAYIAAGSVVTKDVPDNALYICRGPKEPKIVENWNKIKAD
ncbi:MAG: DapH/DapD/GlmU-related protein [bacterium]|nr:DapH/DapD/GlmU-related protein [bacterium]